MLDFAGSFEHGHSPGQQRRGAVKLDAAMIQQNATRPRRKRAAGLSAGPEGGLRPLNLPEAGIVDGEVVRVGWVGQAGPTGGFLLEPVLVPLRIWSIGIMAGVVFGSSLCTFKLHGLPSGIAAHCWLCGYFQLEPAAAPQDLDVKLGFRWWVARSGHACLRCPESSQRGFDLTEWFAAMEIVASELQEAILNPPTIQDGPGLLDGGRVTVGKPAGCARVEHGNLSGPRSPGLDGFDGQVPVSSATGTPKGGSPRLMWFVRDGGLGEGRHRLAPHR